MAVEMMFARRTRMVRLSGLLLIGMWLTAGNSVPRAQPEALPRLPRVAPSFSRIDVARGRMIDLESYRGKVVLLNFWATWCAPCLTEMPVFNEWQQTYGFDKLQVIGISMDDSLPEVVAAVSRLKLEYPVVMGDPHIGTAYGGVLGLPVTFLVDQHGVIRARRQNADLTSLKKDVEKLLKSR